MEPQRIVFYVTTKNGNILNGNNAKVLNANDNTITIQTKKRINVPLNDFESGTVCALQGNHSNIIFFLNDLMSCEKTLNGIIYTFAAPKKRNTVIQFQGRVIKNVDSCVGYNKFCKILNKTVKKA